MNVATPLDARCFLTSRSVPYQLKPLVAWPMRGRWTLALWGKKNTHRFIFMNKKKKISQKVKIFYIKKKYPKMLGI